MRRGALSVLRAQQLIIEQCHVTNELSDVGTTTSGSPHVIGEPQIRNLEKS